ncbi:MAG: hypothetical protein KDA86_22950 [Planctomycetaceae bacterium]|nr:hypothetical protein [Planctomycetaceae bacterium]
MTVKQNQPQLHQRLNELFEQYAQQDYQVKGLRKQISKPQRSHGRTEQRFCYAIGVPPADKVFQRWPSLQSIGLLNRHSRTSDRRSAQQAK